jgi:putative transposase
MKSHCKTWPLTCLAHTLGVSRSGYYKWLSKAGKSLKYAEIDEQIKAIYALNKKRYGVPRITRSLNNTGNKINHKTVAKRMKALGLKAKQAVKFKVTTDSKHAHAVFKNKLEQDFSATACNQKWVADITYVWTVQGWLYLAVIIDLFNREVIGWSMSNRIDKKLVCDALKMALWRKKFPRGVIIHTDRGSQYCSAMYKKLLTDNHLIGSMSSKGCCYDNAVAESFFHTLKVECLYDYFFATREQAKQIIFEYIEVYYNKLRMHSSLDYCTPEQFTRPKPQAS